MISNTFHSLGSGEFASNLGSMVDERRVEKLNMLDDGDVDTGRYGIIGNSPAIKTVLDQVGVVAPTDSTVLIQGETGTGKELFAQAIHQFSRRGTAPFITLNCAAIPAGLLESELFGHERGAFTGAMTQRIGRFEAANGGTLFLDEIGDMALDLQAKLLRVLQEQTFERLGSTRTHRVNVRVVAATHRDLVQMVENKEFRADLFYRLSVFPISLPALRERSGDIPALARHFIVKYAQRMNKVVEDVALETMDAMVAYDWPGNVRQLQNFVEHGVIVSEGPVFQPALNQLRARTESLPKGGKTLEDATRDHILQTLAERSGSSGDVAEPRPASGSLARLCFPKCGVSGSNPRETTPTTGARVNALRSPRARRFAPIFLQLYRYAPAPTTGGVPHSRRLDTTKRRKVYVHGRSRDAADSASPAGVRNGFRSACATASHTLSHRFGDRRIAPGVRPRNPQHHSGSGIDLPGSASSFVVFRRVGDLVAGLIAQFHRHCDARVRTCRLYRSGGGAGRPLAIFRL
jgi:hypothetical protein